MKKYFNLRKLGKNNKGSALIVSIIVLLFVSILATVILYMSGINYRMKKTDLNSRISFYSGEEVLERMQSNLFIPVSYSLNESYRTANTLYGMRGSSDDRRREFYSQFAVEFKELMIEQYGGAKGIGTNGNAITDANLIKYIIYNLSLGNNTAGDYDSYPDRDEYVLGYEVDFSDIYVNNSATVYPGPESYINTLAGLSDRGDGQGYFDGNLSDPSIPRVYVCVSTPFDGGSASANYDKFIRLSVTGDPDDDPVYPTEGLLDPEDCRLLIRNVSVVVVQNGFKSIITTDIAIQMPPLDWGGGGSNPDYLTFNPSNGLIYYVNWQKS